MIGHYTLESLEAALPAEEAYSRVRPASEIITLRGERAAVWDHLELPDMNAAARNGIKPRFEDLSPGSMNEMLAGMLRCLRHIAHDDYPTWRNVLWACADAEQLGTPEASTLAKLWSQGAPERFDETVFQTTFRGFRRGQRNIGIGTLIRMAKENGFDPSPWLPDQAFASTTVVGSPYTQANARSSFFKPIQTSNFRPPPWIIHGLALAGDVSVIAGAGGVSKTAALISLAVATAAGCSFWGTAKIKPHVDERPHRVAYIAAEEDRNRLGLLVEAASVALALDTQERANVAANLIVHDSRESGFRIGAPRPDRREEVVPEEYDAWCAQLRDELRTERISVLIIDTLAANLAVSNENDNAVMTVLMRRVARLAADTRCAVILAHHMPKVTKEEAAARRGEVTAVRGGSAITASARVVWTLTGLPKDEAAQFAIHGSNPQALRRMDPVKINDCAPPPFMFFEVISVPTQTVDGKRHDIRAIQFIATPQAGTNATPIWALQAAMKAVDDGVMIGGARQPLTPAAQSDRAAFKHIAPALQAAGPSLSSPHAEAAAKRVLQELQSMGCVIEIAVTVPKLSGKGGGNPRKGLATCWQRAHWVVQGASALAAGTPPVPSSQAAPVLINPSQPAAAPSP